MQIVRATGADRRQVQRIFLQMKRGSAIDDPMRIKEDDAQRFWRKVDKTPGQGPNGDCWCWTGALDPYGYARGIFINGQLIRGTHLSLLLSGLPRTSGKPLALHSCDNKACVNPGHLRWGTDAENAEDNRQRGQRGAHWLPDETVREILESDERHVDIAARLGLTPAGVCNIRKGRSHRHIFEEYNRMAG